MVQVLSLVTMFTSLAIGMVISSIMVAFSTNSLPATLLVAGIEIIAFFALFAKMEYELNK
jgi:hypothetical protein